MTILAVYMTRFILLALVGVYCAHSLNIRICYRMGLTVWHYIGMNLVTGALLGWVMQL